MATKNNSGKLEKIMNYEHYWLLNKTVGNSYICTLKTNK
jgi:hypothetical protein